MILYHMIIIQNVLYPTIEILDVAKYSRRETGTCNEKLSIGLLVNFKPTNIKKTFS